MPQKLADVIGYFKSTKNKFISVELCPDRKLDADKLARLRPPFCSVTWLDNDLSQVATHPSVVLSTNLLKNERTSVLLHLPGRILTAENAKFVLDSARNEGVTGVLALQGENALMRGLDVAPDDFEHAVDLVKFIRTNYGDDFSVAVTGYPDGYSKAENLETHLGYLKAKVDAGADFIISQSIFDPDTFRLFHRKCRDSGLTLPILPGIYIINSRTALKNMMKFCKLSIPEDILDFVQRNGEDDAAVREYGVRKAAEIIESLLKDEELSILGVHIFSFNDLDLVEELFAKLKFTNVDVSELNL